MRAGIRMNGGRGVCPQRKQDRKPKWHAEICFPTTKEKVRGHSNKVTGCHTKMETIHAARGLQRRVRANSSIKAGGVARDRREIQTWNLRLSSYHSCQGSNVVAVEHLKKKKKYLFIIAVFNNCLQVFRFHVAKLNMLIEFSHKVVPVNFALIYCWHVVLLFLPCVKLYHV